MSMPQLRYRMGNVRGIDLVAGLPIEYADPVLHSIRTHASSWFLKGVRHSFKIIGIDIQATLSRYHASRVCSLARDDRHTIRSTTFAELLKALDHWSKQDTDAASDEITICLLRYTKAIVNSSLNTEEKLSRLKNIDARVRGDIRRSSKSPLIIVHLSITALLSEMSLKDVRDYVRREQWDAAFSILERIDDKKLCWASRLEAKLMPRKWLKDAEPSVFPPDYQPKLLTRLSDDLDRYAQICIGHRLLKRGDASWAQATAVSNSEWQTLLVRNALKVYQYVASKQTYFARHRLTLLASMTVCADLLSDRAALPGVSGKGYVYELEGTLYVRLARCHEKLPSGNTHAVSYYQKAVAHAQAKLPQLPAGKWYMAAEAALKARRDAEVVKKKKAQKPAVAPVQNFENLKQQFEILDGKKMPLKQFLEHLFEKFPPKSPGPKIFSEQMKGDVTRIELKKVIQRYHPDHNGKYGANWRFICEEITKRLNIRKDAFANGNAAPVK